MTSKTSPASLDLDARFAEALAPYSGKVLVACSGGADSLALAHAASRGNNAITLVYIDHGLRVESAAEGQKILDLAQSLGVRAQVVKVQVAKGASLEAAARDARYQALERIANQGTADWVLLGHTRSDQIETIFMRIVRGTGLVGLAGIPVHRKVGRQQFARPLLSLSRTDTETYCRHHRLDYIEDAMNRDERFTRTRVRFHWLPQLRNENPKVDEALLRLADAARDHRDVQEWAAQKYLQGARDGSALQLGASWDALPDSLAIAVLSRFADHANHFESRHWRQLLAFTRKPVSGSAEMALPGATVRREYQTLHWNPPAVTATDIQVEAGYEVRHWQPGDRMRPNRLRGRSKKLSDLFADAKIPRALRPQAWVAVDPRTGEIVWAEHIGHAFERSITVTLPQNSGKPPS